MTPPTWLVIHPRENRKKCSLEPLRGREGLHFVRFDPEAARRFEAPERHVRLAVDGELLTARDAECGLLLLDANWRYADAMNRAYAAVPARSLPGFATAYPRVSKRLDDPPQGLASVEALFIACWILGRPTDGLLDAYPWRERFLAANDWTRRPIGHEGHAPPAR